MSTAQPSWEAACGVSYVSLALTTFGIGEPLRAALSDLAADRLPPAVGAKVQELLECPYCVAAYVALVACRGRPLKAIQLAGMAAVPTSLVLLATRR